MAISHKQKRKILYNGKLYLWYIKRDEDYDWNYYLNIISEDKKTYLSYRINQICDQFIHPKIAVWESDKLETGLYQFFPPIADEAISHNVRAILNWYEKTDKEEKPIKFERKENPFEGIDFRQGKITHIENDFSRENLREDMLQVVYPKGYLLDVGWYGSQNGYVITIIKNEDWETPVAKVHHSFFQLPEAITMAVGMIEKTINQLD